MERNKTLSEDGFSIHKIFHHLKYTIEMSTKILKILVVNVNTQYSSLAWFSSIGCELIFRSSLQGASLGIEPRNQDGGTLGQRLSWLKRNITMENRF